MVDTFTDFSAKEPSSGYIIRLNMLYYIVESLTPTLQAIITDHAYLNNDRFKYAVTEI